MTASVKEALFREPSLQNLSVRGELLGFKLHTSGHAYFTLLGENSRVSCVLFRSYASSVLVWPKDGDEVLVRGKVDVYGARGSYQIYAVNLLPLGAGAKARAKEALRMKLEREGIFDPRLKRPLPRTGICRLQGPGFFRAGGFRHRPGPVPGKAAPEAAETAGCADFRPMGIGTVLVHRMAREQASGGM